MNKIIQDNDAISLINQYYSQNCQCNALQLTLPKIAEYIKNHGYPDYKVTTLRRTTAVRKYIEKLQSVQEDDLSVLMVYRTLDPEAFVAQNKSSQDIIRALTELDNYYHRIFNAANTISKENTAIREKLAELEAVNAKLSADKDSTDNAKLHFREELVKLRRENELLNRILNDYLAPDVFNKLLQDEGIIQNVSLNVTDEDTINANVINSGTVISINDYIHPTDTAIVIDSSTGEVISMDGEDDDFGLDDMFAEIEKDDRSESEDEN